jgi:hypothetical protein
MRKGENSKLASWVAPQTSNEVTVGFSDHGFR